MLVPCEGERVEPVVGGCWIDVTETVRETASSFFYRTNYTFGAVVIAVTFVSENETVSSPNLFERGGVIDQEDRVVDVVILFEFSEKQHRESVRSGRFELRME